MSDKTKFKVGDVVRIKDTAFQSPAGEHLRKLRGSTVEIVPNEAEGCPGDYSISTPENQDEIIWVYADEIETAQPADQQRQPADADLTPDEVATANGITLNRQQLLELKLRSEAPVDVVGESLWHDFYTEMGKLGLIYATPAGHSGIVTYEITAAGRAHLAALTSAPADVPTAAADTIAVSLSVNDAADIELALQALVKDFQYRATLGDESVHTAYAERCKAVLKRLTTQLDILTQSTLKS